jgi:hypothetical protein
MKITVDKIDKEEIELPKCFKLRFSEWYYAIIDEKTLLHVRISAYNYPLIEQVEIKLHGSVISSNEIIEVSEDEFQEKFTEAYLKLNKLSNL